MCIELINIVFYILIILSAWWFFVFLFSFGKCFNQKIYEKRDDSENKKIDVCKDILKNCLLGWWEYKRERRLQFYVIILTILLYGKIHLGLSGLLIQKNITLYPFFPWIISMLVVLVSVHAALTVWKRDRIEFDKEKNGDSNAKKEADKVSKRIKERFFDYAVELAFLFAFTTIFLILAPIFGLSAEWTLFIELVLVFWFIAFFFFIIHHFRELFY